MIDPTNNITIYDRTDDELEEFLIFSIMVAGKTAYKVAEGVNEMFRGQHPFPHIRYLAEMDELADTLHRHKLTPHNQRAKYLLAAAKSKLDLRTCSVYDLVKLPGIQWKTANFFLTHSREGYEFPVIDTHILKFLKSYGFEVPVAPPKSEKKYRELAGLFLLLTPSDKTVAEFDFEVWKRYSKKG